MPMKVRPLSFSASKRRIVSRKFALPASIMMSPLARYGLRISICWSTGSPALIMMMIGRGGRMALMKSSIVSHGMIWP
ncbi:hypothetical protein D3C78_1847350 [compost metagenome]